MWIDNGRVDVINFELKRIKVRGGIVVWRIIFVGVEEGKEVYFLVVEVIFLIFFIRIWIYVYYIDWSRFRWIRLE